MRSRIIRLAAIACSVGMVSALGMGLVAPAQAKQKKPKPPPDLTSKLLTADEVQTIAKSSGPTTATPTLRDVKKGQYMTSYAEGAEAQLPRYMVGVFRYIPTNGGGGTGGGGGGGGGGGRPPTFTCETVEQGNSKTTILCYDESMIMVISGWELTLKTGKWTVSATTTKMLLDFDSYEEIPLTQALKDEEVRIAQGLRDQQKVKAFG